ncbi:MAG: tyrosine-type recombinase/integrase [Flavisolibacter sp.]
MLPQIQLLPFHYRGQEIIAVKFNTNIGLEKEIRKIKGIKWSSQHRLWYLPLSKDSFGQICTAIKGQAEIDNKQLKTYLEQRKAVKPLLQKDKVSKARAQLLIQYPLCSANIDAFEQYQGKLKLLGYSEKTIKTYCNEFHFLLRLLNNVSIVSLTKEHVQSYLLWLIKTKGYSEAHVHTAVNAIKFYFEKVQGRQSEFYNLPRPKKPQKLPDILAEEEVVELIRKTENLKHKALLMTSYSAGLRVSELVTLRIGDIDSKRMMLHIRLAKGKKDRMVPLSKKLLIVLREYYSQYKPKEYVFEGDSGKPYSERSAQMILAEAKRKAGINKKGSIHMLRHSYATHLLESGTDIRYIQSFLGHNSLQTTMIYTHVSKPKIANIESPLDKLKW